LGKYKKCYKKETEKRGETGGQAGRRGRQAGGRQEEAGDRRTDRKEEENRNNGGRKEGMDSRNWLQIKSKSKNQIGIPRCRQVDKGEFCEVPPETIM